MDKTGQSKAGEGQRGEQKFCQKQRLGERTTEDDRQMREAALLSLSSHSALLSISKEYTPSSIPHYTPSCACVCVSSTV